MIAGYLTHQGEAKDYYEMLGISSSEPIGEVKRAVNRLLALTHPDTGGNRDHFAVALEIKEMLLNPVNKEIYDKTGLRLSAVKKVAKEFLKSVLVFWSQGIDNQEQVIQALTLVYEEQIENKQMERDRAENKLARYKLLHEEIEADNVVMKAMFTMLTEEISSAEAEVILLNEDLKELTAKLTIAKFVTLKNKFSKKVTRANKSSQHTASFLETLHASFNNG